MIQLYNSDAVFRSTLLCPTLMSLISQTPDAILPTNTTIIKNNRLLSHKIFGAKNIFTRQTRIDDLETIILLFVKELAEKDQRNLAFDILIEHTYKL